MQTEPENKVPKMFGLRYHQLVAVLLSLIASTQLYSGINPINVAGHDIKPYLCLLIALLGPAYCLIYRKEAIDLKSIWPPK
jgi:hypothetical protein